MNFRCAAASATKSRAAGSVVSSAAPSFEGRIATASKRTDGPPSSFSSASCQVPARVLHAADLRRDQLEHRPFGLQRLAQRREERRVDAVGDQRPDLAAGEALRAVLDDAQRRRRLQVLAGRPGGGRPAWASPSAGGPWPPSRPGRRRCSAGARPSARGSPGVSTLLSSNVRALAMCVCSIARLADVELPGLAVVVGERLRAGAELGPVHRLRDTIW